MANRWVLLLGVALIQGSLSFSPIPEMMTMEEEWAQFAERLGNPEFRLPTTTSPRHYEVTLTPYFDIVPTPGISPFTFIGSSVVYVSPTIENVNEIVMHCNDLIISSLTVTYLDASQTAQDITAPNQEFVCDPTLQFLRIRTSVPLVMSQEYIIRSSFTGNLQTNMRGFYRSWYRDSTGVRWMGTTQFQPGHARQAFPCYDEPGFKATFDISISRDQSFRTTISNMPLRESSAIVNGRITDHFHTTPKTSTYLLAFIVSHYDVVSTNNNANRPFDIYARDNIGTDGDWSLDVGQRLLTEMEAYTQIPYYTMAPNMNMKQAAIPDFSAGAMENWGLLTYREALILYDPAKSNHFYRQRVANIVSHEIAHMWFGNLVTCAWWDNLWLNEGFARFYQYYLTHAVEPELGFDTRFIVEQVQVAMVFDSVDTAHPLTDPSVTDPVSVSAHFSTITYARGAAVLRMTQHLLGDSTFVKALRAYLADRSYDVAEPQDLFNALDAAAVEDNALAAYNGITIDEYFKTWSEKAGHPLLSVSINQETGRMTVVQSRWERTTGVSTYPSLWHIPITWTRQNEPDFANLKPSQFVSAQVSTIERGTSGLEWVIFNKQESGFYRVNYDDTNWALLTRALRSNERTVIHEFNRAQIVDDLFAFGRAGVIPYEQVFNIISFLEFEDGYAPWIAAIEGYEWVIRRLAHSATASADLRNLIIQNSAAVVARLGFSEPTGEAYMASLLRMYVNQFLCNVGHTQCIAAAQQNFQAWRNTQAVIVPNMRPWVYCAGLRAGTAADFDYFWSRYLTEDHASEQVVMLQAAGCTLDEASLGRFWEAITDTTNLHEIIRPQDSSTAISSAINRNEENTMRSFNWIRNNLERTRNSIGLSTPLNTIISRLLNEEQITEVNNWLTANQVLLGESVYNTGINAIATARSNINWYNQRVPEFNRYFETGYVDVELTDPTTVAPTVPPTTAAPATVPPTTAEPTTPEPDSANIAALSFVTLLVTLCINYLANLIIQNSAAVVARLGFSEPTGEAYMASLLRMYVNQFLCNVGHTQCIAAAQQNFQAWRNTQAVIVPNMRPWVYCAGLRAGTAADFDYFWSRYLTEDHASEQVVMLQAAGCTLDEASLGRFWEAITDTTNLHEIIRPQDSSTAISSAINRNEENTMRSFNWIRNNLERTRNSIGLSTPLNTIISRLLNEEQITEVNNWLTANQVLLGESVYNTGINAIATARSNINWYNQRVPEFNRYFETGYVDVELTDPTTVAPTVPPTTAAPATVPPTTAEPTTPEPDSANIAALSFVTLLVTLCINYLA